MGLLINGISLDLSAAARTALVNRLRVEPPDPSRDIGTWTQFFVPSDLRISQEEMQSASVAWGSIRLIVDSLATREVKVFTRDEKGRKHLPDDSVSWMLNVRPNPDMTAQAFKEIVWTQTLLDGDGFGLIVNDMAGRPAQLWPLDSQYMQVLRNRETLELVYRYSHPDTAKIVDLEPAEVLHFRGPSIRGLTGDSALYRAAKAISLSVAQERYATSYYANGAAPGIVLKPPPTSQRKASQEEDDRLRLAWRKAHGNAKGKGHGLAVLEPGWELVNLETDAQKSQIVPARQFSVEDVARYFGVPLVLLGVQAAAQGYGTNVSQLYLVFVRNTLTPWSKRFTEEAQYKLFPQRKPWREIEIDTAPLLRGDELQRNQADEIAIRSGKLLPNEARALDGLNSLGPVGDKPLIASGVQSLEVALKPPAPPPAPKPPPPDGEEGEGEDGDEPMPTKGKPPADIARAAVALDRYARRLESRRKDLEKHAPEKVAENLEAERTRTLPALVDELGKALGAAEDQAKAAAAAVEQGEPAHLAAERLAAA